MECLSHGLKIGPECCQRLMDKILRGAQHVAIAHLDDFCIWSADWESHVIRLREILTRLRKAKLTVHANKCQFAVKKLNV